MKRGLRKNRSPLLVLRVGYMERYDGPDEIRNGGAYVEQRGVGGEIFNFKPSRGKCYGYAMSRHGGGLDLSYLNANQRWQKGEHLDGVDVVFIARRQGFGQVVVGWYRNATVFHKEYRVRRGIIPGMDEGTRNYLCVADAENVTLLSEEARTYSVPYAPSGHKGFPGQSNVWYPEYHAEQPEVSDFIEDLRGYISSSVGQPLPSDEGVSPARGRGGWRNGRPDHAHNLLVEEAAVEMAWSFYERAGYFVQTVETENRGWDLEATKGANTLHIEVKGVSASSVYFELTPNEYAKLRELPSYRVCVVCDALLAPRLYELKPKEFKDGWLLVSEADSMKVLLRERIAAVGVEVGRESGVPTKKAR